MRKYPKLRINLQLVGAFIALLLLFIVFREGEKRKEMSKFPDLPEIHAQGELKILTLYSPSSYFIYRDKEMGYEYEICSMLANDLGLKVKVIVAPNRLAMMQMLKNGVGDVIVYNMPVSLKEKSDFIFCGRDYLTHQVLIQRQRRDGGLLTDVTDLIGKTVVIQKDGPHEQRLVNLNEELGGGINIRALPSDSLSEEDLIGMVSKGSINYTISNNNIANFNKTFYPNINTSLALSLSKHASWAVRHTSVKLAEAINQWFSENVNSKRYLDISKKYFLSEKQSNSNDDSFINPLTKGQISLFDELFKKYGAEINWDWRLLASIAYQESKFDPTAINWTGASGLMQIMPQTGRSVGVPKDSLFNPAKSVYAASKILKIYENQFRVISNNEQRIKMTLAAYNSGIGHVMDARELTRKYDGNPFIWEDNVEKYILLLSRSEYYDDPVCKQGYLRGSETVQFVSRIWARYQRYLKLVPDKKSSKKP